jgi:hypothetical protein
MRALDAWCRFVIHSFSIPLKTAVTLFRPQVIWQEDTSTLAMHLTEKNGVYHVQVLLIGLLWGFLFQAGWSFVPIPHVKGTWSWYGAVTPRGGTGTFSSSRRCLRKTLLSKQIDNDTDEDGWDSKGKDVIPVDEVQPKSIPDVHERDLFIPIFSIIAIGGFVGLYGYEMIRLYLRGELYLPFLH